MAKNHVAVYGSLRMLRGYCRKCNTTALIVKNQYQCCDGNVHENNILHGQKRMIEAQQIRRRPSKLAVDRMIKLQDNKCLYCSIPFGTAYQHPTLNKIMWTKVCYDHFIPYVYCQDNRDVNFVCACGTCNGIKSSKVFATVEEARSYVEYRRAKKGYKKEIYIL